MEIDRIQVPAPMEIEDVNCYLLEGKELTLVDPGPADEETFEALEKYLGELGFEVKDIDHILVTHPHSDHFGNSHRVKEISGADIYAHRDIAPLLADFPAYEKKLQEFFRPYFLNRGIPEEDIETVLSEGIPNQFGTSLEVDHQLEGGETIIEGIEVIETPGHAKGGIAFLIDKELVAGDTVIKGMTPNPTLQLPENGEVPSSLELYLQTLEKIDELDVEKAYGGHREPVTDIHSWIHETEKHHEERKSNILDILEEGDKNGYEIMKSLFQGIEPDTYFLGMSEVIAHIKPLEKEGEVDRYEEDGVIYFSS